MRESRTAAWATVAGAWCVAGFLAWTVVWPSALLRAAETAHLAEDAGTLAAYERALGHPWPNPAGRQGQGIALAERGLNEAAYGSLLAARAGLNTGEVHLALALVAQRLGRLDEAQGWAAACLERWPRSAAAWRVRIETASSPEACAEARAEAGRWLRPEDAGALPECPASTEAEDLSGNRQTQASGRP